MKKLVLALSLIASGSAFAAEPIVVPVTADASLIKNNYFNPNLADSNFGAAQDVQVGAYHLTAEGLLLFNLAPTFKFIYRNAYLVLPNVRIVGSSPAQFNISRTTAKWNEADVSWNTKPEVVQNLGSFELVNGKNVIDVTPALNLAKYNGQNLSLVIKSAGSSNLFLDSKEKNEEGAAYLVVTPFESSVEFDPSEF